MSAGPGELFLAMVVAGIAGSKAGELGARAGKAVNRWWKRKLGMHDG